MTKQSMPFFNKKKILVTHDGTFHADDLFATAVLSILNDGNIKIIRTRDPKMFERGDYVYDVGGEYNISKNIFDHHQKEGAGVRPNGIPYASFGLVWKTYGEKICGSKEVADIIDINLAQPIDAIDNGVDIVKPIFSGVMPYSVINLFYNYLPTWKESNKNIDQIFKEQVKEAEKLLLREIEVMKSFIEGKNIILENYKNTEDKRIIIVDINFPRYLYQDTLSALTEPLYIVMPSGHSSMWKVECIHKSPVSLECRKLFPEAWRGFFDNNPKLKEITGISDVTFCHRSGFLAITLSKEGAIKLAQKALLA